MQTREAHSKNSELNPTMCYHTDMTFDELVLVYPDRVVKKSNQGTVVLGKHNDTGEEIVVKISHKFVPLEHKDHRAGDRLHVLRELKILPQLLGIDGVPQFIASDHVTDSRDTEQFRIAMSKIDGIDFEERRKLQPKRRLTCHEAVDLLRQAGEILKRVHAKNIIHRDLKLSNFMITPDGKVYIVDWGTAKEVVGNEDMQFKSNSHIAVDILNDPQFQGGRTPEDTVIGTVQFVSYEQITGQELDERTDVYSLGAVTALLRYGPHITQRYTIDKAGKAHNREKSDIAKAVARSETLKYNQIPKPADGPDKQCETILQEVLKKMTDPDRHLRMQNMQNMLDLLATIPEHSG